MRFSFQFYAYCDKTSNNQVITSIIPAEELFSDSLRSQAVHYKAIINCHKEFKTTTVDFQCQRVFTKLHIHSQC